MKTKQVRTETGWREALVVEVVLGERPNVEGDLRGYIETALDRWFADVTSGTEIRANAHSFALHLAGLTNLYQTGD